MDNLLLDAEALTKLKENMIESEYITSLSMFFKTLGDETRMKIVNVLLMQELCVSDIAFLLDMTTSAVSHQLKQLKLNGLIKSRRDGKNIYYSLDDDHVKEIIEVALTHMKHKNRVGGNK